MEYKDSLVAADPSAYNTLVSNYETLKYEIANLMAYSGNAEKETAFALANGTIRQCSDEMQRQVEIMMKSAQASASQASEALTVEYNRSVFNSMIIVGLSVVALLITLYGVFILIIRKLIVANREINEIINDIDQSQGDLTKRISILSNDEIADLGNGINTFMGKLQKTRGGCQRSAAERADFQRQRVRSLGSDAGAVGYDAGGGTFRDDHQPECGVCAQ